MTTNHARFLRPPAALIALGLIAALTACSAPTAAIPSTPTVTSTPAQVGTRVPTAYGSYTNLAPKALKAMLNDKGFFLVDVHTPPEGRLPGTDARIPYDQVDKEIEKFPADKQAKIVLTCYSGAMSSIASETLVRLGYKNVYNLDGGMAAWRAAGYQIIPEGK